MLCILTFLMQCKLHRGIGFTNPPLMGDSGQKLFGTVFPTRIIVLVVFR